MFGHLLRLKRHACVWCTRWQVRVSHAAIADTVAATVQLISCGHCYAKAVYIANMRRIQLYIEPDIDDALTAAAAKRGVSRSALMREAVSTLLHTERPRTTDTVDALIGWLDVEPDDDIDAVIYGHGE